MADERPLLAVLIDADNVPAKHAEAILKEVARIGEPALRRVYGDWSSDMLKGWSKIIPSLGLVARQETANTRQKNASDIGLVIDAMDILHTAKFDGFVLVSSDSDFTALANRLREDGLSVIGIGEAKTPDSLRNVCNRFILIENLVQADVKEAVPEKQNNKLSEAYDLFVEAMNRIDTEDDWYNLGGVGSMILAAHPDFDPRSYGHGKLSGLAKALRDIETKSSGNNLLVRLKD